LAAAVTGVQPITSEDYERLLQANLVRVFGERGSVRRRSAIAELYQSDAALYEPGSVATGHEAIDRAVEAVLTQPPAAFVFIAQGP
jgi:hypothetical protein